MKIALLQITSSDKVSDNLRKIESILEKQNIDFDLLILPENFAQMGRSVSDKLNTQEVFGDGLVQTWLRNLAKEYRCWIIAGSFPIVSPAKSRAYARCLVYAPTGQLETYYDKIHLFDVAVSKTESYCESNDTFAGEKPVMVEINGFKIGLSICYDLRFPELYRFYQQNGADLMVAPSAFTFETGKHHWDTLLKARAVENLCFFAAVNQTGTHANGRQTYGHSKVLSPWGQVLVEAKSEEALVVCELDKEHLDQVRNKFPALSHRTM